MIDSLFFNDHEIYNGANDFIFSCMSFAYAPPDVIGVQRSNQHHLGPYSFGLGT